MRLRGEYRKNITTPAALHMIGIKEYRVDYMQEALGRACWEIRVNPNSSEFVRVHQSLSEFVRVNQSSSEFVKIYKSFAERERW